MECGVVTDSTDQQLKNSEAAPPDWRGLCEELTEFAARLTKHYYQTSQLLVRAREALAQPEPKVVGPTDEELWQVGDEDFRANTWPTDAIRYARAVLARWGRSASAPAGEVGPTDDALIAAATEAGLCYPQCWDFESQPERLDHLRSFARAVLARWGRPAPAPAGEVAELVAWLRNMSEAGLGGLDELNAGRAAELLEQLSITQTLPPVPDCERNWDSILSPSGGYEMADDAALRDGAQLVNGEWWAPGFGCDSLESALARIRERLKRQAALAQPEPEVVRPTDEELLHEWDLVPGARAYEEDVVDFARAVVARWGNRQGFLDSPAPALAGEVAASVKWLRMYATGEFGSDSSHPDACQLRRAADLLERQAAPVPVPVSERLPGPEDCDVEGRCWWWYPPVPEQTYGYWIYEDNAVPERSRLEWPDSWLSFNALPLPSGEVEHG